MGMSNGIFQMLLRSQFYWSKRRISTLCGGLCLSRNRCHYCQHCHEISWLLGYEGKEETKNPGFFPPLLFPLLVSFFFSFLSFDKKYRASLEILSVFTWYAFPAFVLPLSSGWEMFEKEKTNFWFSDTLSSGFLYQSTCYNLPFRILTQIFHELSPEFQLYSRAL